jgi:cytochrome P450
MFIVPNYEDVITVLGNPELFSSSQGNLLRDFPERFGRTLGTTDNPTHDEIKNTVKNAYSKDNIERVIGSLTDKVNKLTSNTSTINVSQIAEQISIYTVLALWNIPHKEDVLYDIVLDINKNSNKAIDENTYETNNKSLHQLIVMLKYLFDNKIKPQGPGIYNEFYKNYTTSENVSLFTVPVFAGVASMNGALQYLTLDLGNNPDQFDLLLNNHALIPNAINESIRYNTSTGRFARTVTKEVTLRNTILKPGDRVAVCLDSANRDPAIFVDADKFDINRNAVKSVGFGYGLHSCIALVISKAVMALYLKSLLTNVGKFSVVTKSNDFKYLITAPGNFDVITNLIIEK